MGNVAWSSGMPCDAHDSLVHVLEGEVSRLRAANEAWKAQVDAMAARLSTLGREASRSGKNTRRFRRQVRRARERTKKAWRNLEEHHENELRELRALHAAVEAFQARAHARGVDTSANAVLDAAAAACPPLVSRVAPAPPPTRDDTERERGCAVTELKI